MCKAGATQVGSRMTLCTSLEVRRVGRRVCRGSDYAKPVGGGMRARRGEGVVTPETAFFREGV